MILELAQLPDGKIKLVRSTVKGKTTEGRALPLGRARVGDAMPAVIPQSNRSKIGKIIRSKEADLAMTAGVTVLSVAALSQADTTLGKVLLGLTTGVLGGMTVGKALDTFNG